MMSRYLHLSPLGIQVRAGQTVTRGQVIAYVGLTGLTTGCHLHFEIWKQDGNGSSRMDPESIFNVPVNSQASVIESFIRTKLRNVRPNGIFKTFSCGVTYQEVNGGQSGDGSNIYSGIVLFNNKLNAALLVKNGIYEEYMLHGGPCGVLGLPNYTSGWINGKYYASHYTEAEGAKSPYNTTGYYQIFENGHIYWNNSRNDAYAVYGVINQMYQQTGGTAGVYGFPEGNQYTNEIGQKCQKFEYSEPLCVGMKDYDKDGLDDDLENELAYIYTPIVYFDNNEDIHPTNVGNILYSNTKLMLYNGGGSCNKDLGKIPNETFLTIHDFDKVISFGGTCIPMSNGTNSLKIKSSSIENYDDDHYYYLDLDSEILSGTTNTNEYELYSRIYKNTKGGVNIQYWFFYPNNIPPLAPLGFKHIGDWEHITVELKEESGKYIPVGVYYAEHETGNPGHFVAWDSSQSIPEGYEFDFFVEKLNNTHPKVFVAHGTHASYPKPPQFSIINPGKEEDFDMGGVVWKSWENGKIINLGEISSYGNSIRNFINYSGRWGGTRKGDFGDIPGVGKLLANSPNTMSFQSGWFWNEKK